MERYSCISVHLTKVREFLRAEENNIFCLAQTSIRKASILLFGPFARAASARTLATASDAHVVALRRWRALPVTWERGGPNLSSDRNDERPCTSWEMPPL